ncbi:MAG: maltose alpha-D-glucosyltransferase [Candidatus Omnitrophica bacterium]|nr:maltose alpha-D-glucosyltransferase [Candidatus Omnitrophota bacterium]
MAKKTKKFKDDLLWYKDAIIYQVHIKSFYDSNADGIGDIPGLTQKLDHLQKLGVTAVWVLPFYPSPLRDDGYDIADYFAVHPQYGTIKDFKEFLNEAHSRGIRVITELVINHTSDQHDWFQKARMAKPGSALRNYYVWSDDPKKYKEARIIFKDFEPSNWTWDPVAKSYYWHRFYSHQPDLNFDNPLVHKELFKVVDFWMEMGVDGMRLDAVPYLYEREGTNCENLPETYAFLKKLRSYVDSKYKNKMLLAEANQWPEDAVAYFGEGDSCQMAFHFPLMPRMFMAMQMEDNFPIKDILEQTPAIPDACQWAIFLRNHDELTLEMVTDEERDYMYHSFAKDSKAKINLGIRRRLMPLLGNNRKKVELMNILLLSLPGTPIIYYGDEIGMGDNFYLGDRNGVRTPMQWSPDKNAGFSQTNPQRLYLPVVIDPEYQYSSVNVENQEGNLSSLLWWMRRVIFMRKKFKAFSRGTLDFLYTENKKVLVFVRKFEEEVILCVINLSRFSQAIELNLAEYAGYIPEEIFSQNKFPQITQSPYVVTLGAYTHFWFVLKKATITTGVEQLQEIPTINLSESWREIFERDLLDNLENQILPQYLPKCRWFGQKANAIKSVKITEMFDLLGKNAVCLFVNVVFYDGIARMYSLILAYEEKTKLVNLINENPQCLIANLVLGQGEGYLYDGIYDASLQQFFLDSIADKKRISGRDGRLLFYPGKSMRLVYESHTEPFSSKVLKAEQSNSSIIYGQEFFLKFFRQIKEGVNPDLEITKFLTEKTSFSHFSSYAGAIQYVSPKSEPTTLAMLSYFIPNQGDTWAYFLDQLGRYFENILSNKDKYQNVPVVPVSLLKDELPENIKILSEASDPIFPEMIKLLGQRTREMHEALASQDFPDFVPEDFTILYQRSVLQSMQGQLKRVFQTLHAQYSYLPKNIQKQADIVFASEKNILKSLLRIKEKKLSAARIRIHGDYHLGQVLFTGKDFTIIDFEGEPSRSVTERKLKRSAFRDVAGMIRSFHYAAFSSLLLKSTLPEDELKFLEPWAHAWYFWASQLFLKSYLGASSSSVFIPTSSEEIELLLDIFLLDKAVYELGYELNNRPAKTLIPLTGIKYILGINNASV